MFTFLLQAKYLLPLHPLPQAQEVFRSSSKGRKNTSWCGIGKRKAWKQHQFHLLFSCDLPFCQLTFKRWQAEKNLTVIAVIGKGAILKMHYFSINYILLPPTPNYKPTTHHHAEVQRNNTNHPIFHYLTVLNKNYNTNLVSCTILSSFINEGCILGRFDWNVASTWTDLVLLDRSAYRAWMPFIIIRY